MSENAKWLRGLDLEFSLAHSINVFQTPKYQAHDLEMSTYSHSEWKFESVPNSC